MRISIFGLGYVGTVCSACLAEAGHTVIGVDPNRTKVDILNDGRSPIVERDVESMIREARAAGRLKATTDEKEAVACSDVTFVCVGTPSNSNGSLNLDFIRSVAAQLGAALRSKDARHVIVIRSTVLPGTCRKVVVPIIEKESGKSCGQGFGVAFNPEFLREATAVEDFRNPPKTVIGAIDPADADTIASLYSTLEAPLVKTSLEVAEMVKYADNAFHAVKTVFGNEIGVVCKAMGVDSHAVMEIFCKDTKLNLSPYYLKPGFAFGGSCLPKDLRAITHAARSMDIEVPMLSSVMASNQEHVRRTVQLVANTGLRRVGVLGFAFKAGTDDLRESPVVELIETLHGKGFDVRIYDRNVSVARLVGANKEFIRKRLPHVSQLMVDTPEEIISHAQVVIIGNKDPLFARLLDHLTPEQVVVDLVRIADKVETPARYEGICW